MKTYALHTLAAVSLSISPRIYSSLTFLMSFAVDFEERDTVTIKRFICPKCFAQFSLCIDKNLFYDRQSTFSRKLVHAFFYIGKGQMNDFSNYPIFIDKLIASEKKLPRKFQALTKPSKIKAFTKIFN